jgi:hypothetical protein
MDKDPMFNINLAFGNFQPIEGAATIPDVYVLEAQYQQERHEQSEFQRFLRQHNHNTTIEDLGSAGYDPALGDRYRPLVPQLEATKPIEERLEMLRYYSTVESYEFRRYSLEFYAGTLGQARETMHPLEKAFICNKLGLHIEALLLVYKSEFPFVPWSDA